MNKHVVNSYSLIDNLDILQEECAELIAACSKVKRAHDCGYITEASCKDSGENLIEVISDVKSCIDAIMSIMDIQQETIDKIDESKSNRALERLEKKANFSKK